MLLLTSVTFFVDYYFSGYCKWGIKLLREEMQDNFWYCIYDHNFQKITICRKGTEDLVVPLMN
jgi:hypothetical protein